jgi:Pentapeptide repeats (8 copies)
VRWNRSIQKGVFWSALALLNLAIGWMLIGALDVPVGWTVAVLVSLYLLLACVALFPQVVAPRPDLRGIHDPKDRIELAEGHLKAQNELRVSLFQGLGGLVLLSGALFAWHQFQEQSKATREQLDLARKTQIVERFARAVDQLGSAKTETKLGAVASLEQIAAASPDDRQAVRRSLAGFLRSGTRFDPPRDPAKAKELGHDFPEFQAAVDVLSRLNADPPPGPPEPPLNLARVDLIQADLDHAHLMGAILRKAKLQSANLTGADLSHADLTSADLANGIMKSANLTGANLTGANLSGADLTDAALNNANLAQATTDAQTKWPEGVDPCKEAFRKVSC